MTKKNKYRPFEESREFVRSLDLKSQREWIKYTKIDNFPSDIRKTPSGYEKFISTGDWLGYQIGVKGFRPFEEARELVRSLGLKSWSEWDKYIKRDDFPSDIRKTPERYEEFISIYDWLGHTQKIYRPFEEAREFVRSLDLKSQREWIEYTKRDDFPSDIRKIPSGYEKYTSTGDWLGYQIGVKGFRPFEEAREWARSLGLKSWIEWIKYTKRDDFPSDIRKTPSGYEKYTSTGDWLGYQIGVKGFRPFGEAREWIRSLGLKSWSEWDKYIKRDDFPSDIRKTPEGYEEFISIYDWLGHTQKIYRPFEEAREWARSLGLKSWSEWIKYTKIDNFPSDIRKIPSGYEKYTSTCDWLGCVPNCWSKSMIIDFFKSIRNDIGKLDQIHLLMIIKSANMTNALKSIDILQDIIYEKDSYKQTLLVDSLEEALEEYINIDSDDDISVEELLEAERELANKLSENDTDVDIDTTQDEDTDEDGQDEITIDDLSNSEEMSKGSPIIKSVDDLKAFDNESISHYFDDETVEFFISSNVNKLWQTLHTDKDNNIIEELRVDSYDGVVFKESRTRFLEQWDGATNLELPDNYIFKYEPSQMQFATAYRLLKERYLGNWSGTGAGKSLSALLSSKVLDAKITIIIGFNSTMDEWEEKVNETYSDCVVYNKPKRKDLSKIDSTKTNFILLNYEKFQNEYSENYVKELLKSLKIDFIVMDEIQFVKQRDVKNESTRRLNVKNLRVGAEKLNPELRVLGMSATPVINNLEEGKKALEMVLGDDLADIKTGFDIYNGSALHRLMINHGIRCVPKYEIKLNETHLEIDGTYLTDEIIQNKKNRGGHIKLEQILLDIKLEKLDIKKGEPTIIFSLYHIGIFSKVLKYYKNKGYSIGTYYSGDKSGISEFKKGNLDILLTTESIGTGVDGLQYVCNNMVCLVLPWTSASYEQLRGRIYRQGSEFGNVNITIPIVKITNEKKGVHWSWDELRLKRIKNKKEWADLVMDGKIPNKKLPSKQDMMNQAVESLEKLMCLEINDDTNISDRDKLECGIDLDSLDYTNSYYTETNPFTTKNRKWNTSSSKTMNDKIKTEPKFWEDYHKDYRDNRRGWDEIPFDVIGKAVKTEFSNNSHIADFGCGEDLLRLNYFPNNENYKSFDHCAINDNVTACDVSNTPLEDSSMDLVICSLSLMGINCYDYIKEASRVLKHKKMDGLITTQKAGTIIIAEPKNRWKDDKCELFDKMFIDNGFDVEYKQVSGNFIYLKANKI